MYLYPLHYYIHLYIALTDDNYMYLVLVFILEQ